ncbi:cartilage intermediate layer protein 1-like [Saccoglossus kowalevskii]|uniref:Cartilage intermediate layer protein 1-like n=1 Tax=Saccoglossus kowalevskii TaxID=10224 RepID=A0ABM0GVZ8_SACKO|nr:PREDICTED: cartilage intermediate layer protein 1-like [Saccoglossus kowalevskii]
MAGEQNTSTKGRHWLIGITSLVMLAAFAGVGFLAYRTVQARNATPDPDSKTGNKQTNPTTVTSRTKLSSTQPKTTVPTTESSFIEPSSTEPSTTESSTTESSTTEERTTEREQPSTRDVPIRNTGTQILRRYITPVTITPLVEITTVSSTTQNILASTMEPPPYLQADTSWLTWGEWTACGTTCGGGNQIRYRACYTSNIDITCSGSPVQSRTCAQWDCPDCSRTCQYGDIDSDCSCICKHDVLDGVVVDVDGRPVYNASIFREELPLEPIAASLIDGSFHVEGLCIRGSVLIVQKLKFTRKTYALPPTTNNAANYSNVVIVLEKNAHPFITVNPENKIRHVGQSVGFCCDGYGSPNPSYYEWFKDGDILEDWSYTINTSLLLNNLTVSDAGTYTCRINSDIGAAYSLPAVLDIYDDPDPCTDSLQRNYIELPPGCIGLNGSSRYDIGICSRSPCSGDLVAQECTDSKRYCCVESNSEKRQLQCSSFNISIIVTTECNCGECYNPIRSVRGRVIAADTREPIKYGKIYLGSEFLRQTSRSGEFEFEVPAGRKRLTITIRDIYDEYADATKVFTISQESQIYRVILLQRLAPTVSFNSSESFTVPLTAENAVEIDIPAMSLRTVNGSVYTANASASITFVDPKDPQAVDIIQSDLSTRDVEGNLRSLQTYGMLSINFEDETGNTLYIDGNIQVYYDLDILNISVTENNLPKMWYLEENTGEWVETGSMRVAGERRRKRDTNQQIIVGDIEVNTQQFGKAIINVDYLAPLDEICFLKVKVYDTLNTPIKNAEVNAITNEQGQLSVFEEVYTDANGAACPRVMCHADINRYLINVRARFEEEVLLPQDPNTAPSTVHPRSWPTDLIATYLTSAEWDSSGFISFSGLKQSHLDNGPLHPSRCFSVDCYTEAKWRCSNSAINDSHVIFKKEDHPVNNDKIITHYTKHYEFSPTYYEEARDKCSWYPYESDRRKRTCFMKILVTGQTENRFQVTSSSSADFGCGEYGFRAASTSSIIDEKAALCMEFKCSDYVRESDQPYDDQGGEVGNEIDETIVKIIPNEISQHCTLLEINREFQENVNIIYQGEAIIHVMIPTGSLSYFGVARGLYESTGEAQEGYDIANESCFRGNEVASTEPPYNPTINWALHYEC